MNKLIFLLLPLLFLIVSCTQPPPQDNSALEQAHQTITQQEQEIERLNTQIESLRADMELYDPKEVDYSVDLFYWSQDELVAALKRIDSDFEQARWFQYEYTEDGRYYDLVGPFYPYDPFHKLAYDQKNRQLTVNALRIFNLDPGRLDESDSEYEAYLQEVNKQSTINPSLKCIEQLDCRGVRLITCNAEERVLYSWYAYPYLFVTRDDGGRTFIAFKEFYCELS